MLKDTVGEAAEAPSQQGNLVFITSRRRVQLPTRGYDAATIDKMTPDEPHKIFGVN